MVTLKKVRLEKGLTQLQLFLRTGIGMSRISMIETSRYIPSDFEKETISKALDLRPEDISWPELKEMG